MTNIAICYGIPTGWPGYLVGAGYGRDEAITRLADACGEWLAEHTGQDVTVRCNSDGHSGGAFHDMDERWGSWYGLSTKRLLPEGEPPWSQNRTLVFAAFFLFPMTNLDAVKANVPHHDLIVEGILCPAGWAEVLGPSFSTLAEAGAWLLRWGSQFCPHLRQALDGTKAE